MNTFLRDQREHRALSAEDVARRLDVHPMSVLRWERRERLPGPGHVKALASTLDLETSMVAGFFDEARPTAEPSVGLRAHGLRTLRQAAGIPVRRVARRLGVLPATVYNWEAGRARLPLEHLPDLAALLGIGVPALRRHLADAPASRREQPASELRRLRRRTGLSQTAVAQRVGTTRHRLGAWERGEQPPLWAVRRLAAVYGVPVSRVARASGVSAPPLLDVRRWSPGDLPQALVALRQWSGLTQGALAERCGCHPSTVRGWEQGRARPLHRTRARLEALYGLPEGALLAAYPDER
ncbi:helix-turn-helix transcriptional regulator [Nocardioides gansuensis]|uniref:helix-turn-helix transcriptional regulator n=1 Tax=Nocardioides gansuensis TaxID=2138300 RepID=UPI001057D469|nr:helix-turn-helix transcriptional regulator [Nocardioides gansuensis]